MGMIDFSQFDVDFARPVNTRNWHCPNPDCGWADGGEIEGPEYCALCGTEALPGSLVGLLAPNLAPEGRYWECPAGCQIWYGSLWGPERCPRCQALARPSQFEGLGPHEP
jgi:hypothetical protein